MSCEKAREIDLAAYLVDPDRFEWAEFRNHYPTCPDCAEELSAWTRIEASLRSYGDPDQGSHPSAEFLACFGGDPHALIPQEWNRVDEHTRKCRQCADELAALREFDLSALEKVSRTTVGETANALRQFAAELLRSLVSWTVSGGPEQALTGLFGAREPDFEFQSRGRASTEPATEKAAPFAVLVALEGEVAGVVFTILAGESRIGRAKDCEIRIPSQSLSRVEASIRAESDELEITALHERAPVLINGEPVRSGPLGDGDLLQIGSERFQIRRVTSKSLSCSRGS